MLLCVNCRNICVWNNWNFTFFAFLLPFLQLCETITSILLSFFAFRSFLSHRINRVHINCYLNMNDNVSHCAFTHKFVVLMFLSIHINIYVYAVLAIQRNVTFNYCFDSRLPKKTFKKILNCIGSFSAAKKYKQTFSGMSKFKDPVRISLISFFCNF